MCEREGVPLKLAELLLWTKPPWWFPWPADGGLKHTHTGHSWLGLTQTLRVCVSVSVCFAYRFTGYSSAGMRIYW